MVHVQKVAKIVLQLYRKMKRSTVLVLQQYDLYNQWPISSFLVVDYVPLALFTCGKVLEWLSNHLVVHDGLD